MKYQCDYCGKSFRRTPNRVESNKHKFCSLKCRAKYYAEREKNNPSKGRKTDAYQKILRLRKMMEEQYEIQM